MNRRKFIIQYVVFDIIGSALVWAAFYIFRKLIVEPAKYGYRIPVELDENFYFALVIIPLFWVFIYALIGTYKDIYRKSRLKETTTVLVVTFIGTIILFFLFLIDDEVRNYKVYRMTFLTLFSMQFFVIATLRFVILSILKNKIRKRIISFKTLMIGSNEKALKLVQELQNEKDSQGYDIIGFVNVFANTQPVLDDHLPWLGDYKELKNIIHEHGIEVVIIAIDTSEHEVMNRLLSILKEENISIKIIPAVYDVISGSVKLNYIFGTALIDISPDIMPQWQKYIKRFLDVGVSVLILILFTPLFILIAIAIKTGSKGEVFYKQERIGKNSKPFIIYKFRTMHQNAESNGPELSSDNDPRITKAGRLLRKYRIDELPQFFNVLKGEMSIIGPRPEREFYIKQIVEDAPQYRYLLKVRPGITSWGQIKYGYAENVDQMIDRMKFDILYIENMSLSMDFKIVFYTMLIILKGKGK